MMELEGFGGEGIGSCLVLKDDIEVMMPIFIIDNKLNYRAKPTARRV